MFPVHLNLWLGCGGCQGRAEVPCALAKPGKQPRNSSCKERAISQQNGKRGQHKVCPTDTESGCPPSLCPCFIKRGRMLRTGARAAGAALRQVTRKAAWSCAPATCLPVLPAPEGTRFYGVEGKLPTESAPQAPVVNTGSRRDALNDERAFPRRFGGLYYAPHLQHLHALAVAEPGGHEFGHVLDVRGLVQADALLCINPPACVTEVEVRAPPRLPDVAHSHAATSGPRHPPGRT